MMKNLGRAIRVSENVWWVGAVDWAIKDFHGYSTERGSTYNAYLVTGEKTVLIDTVKAPFFDEMMSRISSVMDPSKIDLIVSNHAEMDHSGALPRTIEAVRPEKVFASVNGAKALKDHFHLDTEITPLKTGDSLSLGNMTLKFVETKMLHWPDSMFTYLDADKVLFSQDGFGMHLASSKLFEDELDPAVIRHEAGKYFANILMPFSSQILKLGEALPGLNLDIKIIAPDHGPVWREDPMRIVKWYMDWAAQKRKPRAVIAYDTMWQSTAKMAGTMADGIRSTGVEVGVAPLSSKDRSFLATELLECGAFIVGSPTINNNIFPTLADAMTYIKGLRPKNLLGAAFGSYGWSGEAVGHLNETLTAMGATLLSEGLKVKYVPDDDAIKQCFDMGVMIGNSLLEKYK